MQKLEDLRADDAIGTGNAEVNALLAQPEANAETLNAQDNGGRTVLMWAVMYGKVEVVNALLGLRDGEGNLLIDVNIKDNGGRTALILAVIERNAEVVNALLAHLVDINVKDNEGLTALMHAKFGDNIKIVREISSRRQLTGTALQRSSLFSNVSEDRAASLLGLRCVR